MSQKSYALKPTLSTLLLLIAIFMLQGCMPEAKNDEHVVLADSKKLFTLHATDKDPNHQNSLTYRIIQYPKFGNATLNKNKVTYQPAKGFIGLDSIEFVASDGIDTSAPATVTLKVGPSEKHGLQDFVDYDFLVGAAFNDKFVDDDKYKNVFSREFNVLTPENAFKPTSLISSDGSYHFDTADKIMDFASSNGISVRGHTLLWHQSVINGINAKTKPEEVERIIDEYIEKVVGRYAGRVYAWDVANEITGSYLEQKFIPDSVSPVDSRFRNSIYMKKLGKNYLAKVINKVKEVDPSTKVFINDYLVADLGEKSNNLFSIIKELIDDGVPIDGVGFQMHAFMQNPKWDDMIKNMKRYDELGIEVSITELDISSIDPQDYAKLIPYGTTAVTDIIQGKFNIGWDFPSIFGVLRPSDEQKRLYFEWPRVCYVSPNCNSVTVWGVEDSNSWLWDFTKPLLFTPSYDRKHVYYEFGRAVSTE
ncbi:endo-1,4-beta-xylanase [Grimontia kaedaensis]|uniref:Beta-xylanase n=1 Tax=Grimontia kaedaensis TaxID=2872157 RepID=A0ABY4X0Q8_9GAMM|nr:endo-1,4-beta-xylanase [Grimontia kaedaensis]USH04849.1 endo-1,4-beta-xylanase [Grimontia kaedaensis]